MKAPLAYLRFLIARLDRRALDHDMDEEIAAHIALRADALERTGLASAEAQRQARVEFGGVQHYREEGREARSFSWMHDIVADLRYAARTLRRSPGFALVCIVSLGLGIGANTAIFGLLYGILIQPLPVSRASELSIVGVTLKGESYAAVGISRQDYLALRAVPGLPPLDAVNEANDIGVAFGTMQDFAPLSIVEPGFFDFIGVRPTLGRTISASDDGTGASVVVISDGLWEKLFARDPAALGKSIALNGQPFTIIGIMPSSYHGMRFNGRFGVAIPQSATPLIATPSIREYVFAFARIASPAARTTWSAQLDLALHRCCFDGRERDAADRHASFIDASRGVPFGKDDFRGEYQLVLWLLMGGVFLVLLIACSNVGNLLLARAASRERELAVRLSLGASRARIVRQLLVESALLAALGGVVGFGLAALDTNLLIRAMPSGVASSAALIEFHAKPAILAFTALVSLLCVFAFGLGPALRATRGDLVSSLKERNGSAARSAVVDRLLVVGQVAVTLVLVSGAGLLVATLHNLRSIDPGFAEDHLVSLMIETRGTSFESGGITPIYEDILDRIQRTPGIRSAGMATRVPAIGGRNASQEYEVIGATSPSKSGDEVDVTVVSPRYFATAATPIVMGRDVDGADTRASTPVAVVNEAFARRHFAGRSAIGGQVRLLSSSDAKTLTIVGVVHDVRFGNRRAPQDPMLYVPASQAGKWPFLVVLMRTDVDSRALRASVEGAVASVSRNLRATRWITMDDAFDEVLLRERLAAGLATICAALALGLAIVGLAGLVGYSVARRTREIGVRMALGARGIGVVWLILRGTLSLVGVGVLLGVPLALMAGATLKTLLYGIGATNIGVLAGAAVALLIAGVGASAVPAWRAARVDPVASLRAD